MLWRKEGGGLQIIIIMTDVINITKKAFTWSVVVMTIAWSMGLAALAPLAANAATCSPVSAGDVIQSAGSNAVWVVTSDLKRMAFPNSHVYHSWYPDFSGLQVLPVECYSNIQAASQMVKYRPGSFPVRFDGNNRVYVVGENGMLHWVKDGAFLKTLYGENALKPVGVAGGQLVGILPLFESSYTIGADLDTLKLHNGMLVKVAGSSDVWAVMGGKLHKVTGTLASFVAVDVRTVSQALVDALEVGADVTAASITADPTQGAVTGSGPTTPVETGSLTVSLAANSPATTLVPAKATHVPYLTFKITANGGDTTVETITFKRIGLGDNDNFDKVWLTSDGVPVSNDQSVNSDDTVTLSPNMMIKAGQSATLTLVANLDPTSGADTSNQDGFQIASASSIEISGTGTVGGAFPVKGSLMNYSSYVVGTVTLDEEGSAEDVEIGDEQVIVGEFSLDYNSDSESDGMVDYVRLKQDGSADLEDLDNLSLYEDGELLSGATASVYGDYVTFRLSGDDARLKDGDKRRFEIRADIMDGTDDETYQFKLDDLRDLFVRETETGFGGTTTNSLSVGTGSDGMYDYTLDAGQFSISLDSTNPNNETYSKGSQDVVALVAKVDAGQQINVDGLKVYLETSSSITAGSGSALKTAIDVDIERAELYVNDKRISSLTSVAGTSADGNVDADEFYYDFDSSFSVKDNDLIKLVLDIDEDAVSNTYRFVISNSGSGTNFDSPEYQTNGDSVPDVNKTGTATGRDVQISDASVTVTRNDGYRTNEPFIIGSQNNKVFGFIIDNGDDSKATVRTLNFDLANFTASATSSRVQNMYLTFDGVKVGQTKDLSSGSVTFNSLNKSIDKNKQVQVALYADFATGLNATATTTITLDASESVIEDVNSDDITNWSDVDSAVLQLVADPVLNVSVDGNTVKSAVVVANGATPVTLGTYRFEAKNGNVTLTDLYIANNYTTGSNTAESAADFLVSEYQLVNEAGTVLDTAVPTSGKAQFDLGNNKVLVGTNQVVRLSVRAKMNSITDDSQTGQQFKIALYAIEADGPNAQLSSITGVAVTDTVAALDAAPTLNAHQVARTAPTITAGGHDFVDPSYQRVLVNGDAQIFEFDVAANASGDVSWKGIVLTPSGNCTGGAVLACLGATTSMRIEDANGNTIAASFSTTSISGKLTITLDGVDTISAGQVESYSVFATIAGFTGDNDSLTVKVADAQTAFAAANVYASVTSNTFIWSDNSGSFEATTTDTQWFNGYRTNGLDTKTLTLKQ
jgi:hypothetical protein